MYERTVDTVVPPLSNDRAVYDKRSAAFHRDHISHSTVDGRIECDYILPDDLEIPPTEYVSDEDFEWRTYSTVMVTGISTPRCEKSKQTRNRLNLSPSTEQSLVWI